MHKKIEIIERRMNELTAEERALFIGYLLCKQKELDVKRSG